MSELDGLIDSKISLITHNDVKYDGTLFSINANESSMVLKDVKCLGTEDRVTDPTKKVPPNGDVVPFVTFPGQDIKDLIVHDPTAQADPPTPPPARQQQQQQRAPPPAPERNNENRPQHHQQQQHGRGGGRSGGRGGRGGRREPRSDGAGAGTGAHLLKLRERKNHEAGAGSSDGGNKDIASAGEFDFQAGLSVFKKDDELAKVAGGKTSTTDSTDNSNPTPVAAEISYRKDDFFDSLSCDLVDRQAGRNTRLTAHEERSLNTDTFGAIALQNNNYRRYYGRGGRGRATGSGYRAGGRGYGGGRGRGGGRGPRPHYSHNNHNNTSSHDSGTKIQQPK